MHLSLGLDIYHYEILGNLFPGQFKILFE